jgi:basic amino acid/polyamine antiporter, APA family
MSSKVSAASHRLLLRKNIHQATDSADGPSLRRSLGPVNLVLLGVGCIIGAGVYVMTGTVAANYAGPAVVLSFAVSGLACGFAALCYAELAAVLPVAGSAYAYAYAVLGEVFAWIMGWLLLLEYGVSAAGVAVGWSASVSSFLQDIHLAPPKVLTTSLLQATWAEHGLSFSVGSGANLLAAAGVLGVCGWLLLGIKRTASLNAVAVVLKVGILLLFLAVGVFFVHPSNWHPFIPPNEGGSRYGVVGVVRGASAIFFAYIGFEAVSTAAAEARNPRRDIPIGILGSLLACIVLYMAVGAVLTGIVPFRELSGAAPIALAATRIGLPWFSVLIKTGSIAGLTSVMLVLVYGQTRVFLAMAQDGLLPEFFGRISPTSGTPVRGTLVLGATIAGIAALLPIELLGDLVSLGTATAFAMVCASVLWLRRQQPGLARPFRAPGGQWVPLVGIGVSLAMTAPVLIDMIDKARHGDVLPGLILVGYLGLGAAVYAAYGVRFSRIARALAVA